MSGINGELLALYQAERLREREECIACIRAVGHEVTHQAIDERPTLSELIELLVGRIRSHA